MQVLQFFNEKKKSRKFFFSFIFKHYKSQIRWRSILFINMYNYHYHVYDNIFLFFFSSKKKNRTKKEKRKKNVELNQNNVYEAC